jgi:uncharacterized membrane protein YfcA
MTPAANLLAGFGAISVPQLLLIAVVALCASVIGGVSGYGSGALMPLVLVPLVGAEPVVPIIAIAAMFTNSSRAMAFAPFINWRRALIVLACSVLTCVAGAYLYTLLNNKGALTVIGLMLCLSVPLRRFLKRRAVELTDRGLAFGAVGYGLLVGGTSGSGVVLLSLLMAAGVQGAAVIATDAVVSIFVGIVKVSVFGLAGALTMQVIAVALLMGFVALPGAFLAKKFVERMPVHVHTAILDAVVIVGGLFMIVQALRA